MGRAALQLWVLVSAMLVVRPIFKGKWSVMQEIHQPWYIQVKPLDCGSG